MHLLEKIMAEVLGQAGGGDGGRFAGPHAEGQGNQGDQDQEDSPFPYFAHVFAVDPPVDQDGHEGGDEQLHDHFADDEDGGQPVRLGEFAQAFEQEAEILPRTAGVVPIGIGGLLFHAFFDSSETRSVLAGLGLQVVSGELILHGLPFLD